MTVGAGQDARPVQAGRLRSRGLLLSATRVAAALGLVALWLAVAAPAAWERWTADSPPNDQSPDELAGLAARLCPAAQRVLLLTDNPVGWMRGSYLLYPRRLDVVQRVDGFTDADLDTHAGGCVLNYGPQTHDLAPFSARLSALRSGESGVLYRIAP